MKKYRTFMILALVATIFSATQLWAQNGQKKERNWSLTGYVKDLRTFIPADGFDSLVIDNLLHNRINFKWHTSKSIITVIEARNRVFYGEVVRKTPGFSKLIDADQGILDMSILIVDEPSFVFHSMIDRANISWAKKKLDIRVGRQRINWGVNLVWNPNDLFNNFSWFDFDYEERPGTDGIRIQYYTGVTSSLEIAAKAVDDAEDFIGATMWKFNKKGYDFQLLGGVAEEDLVVGGGWAGNIKKAGWKGEFSYFHPYENPSDTEGIYSITVSLDYSFKNSLYLHGAALYNSNGTSSNTVSDLMTSKISAKNLFPYQYAYFGQMAYPITPLFNSGLAVIYSPGDNILFLNPSLTISLKDNWEVDLLGQLFFSDMDGTFKSMGQYFFTRLKWSY